MDDFDQNMMDEAAINHPDLESGNNHNGYNANSMGGVNHHQFYQQAR